MRSATDFSDPEERYAYLRRVGETACPPEDIAKLRRWAKRDGFAFSQFTSRDYMGRRRTSVSLHDGTGNLVRPDA